MLFSGLLDLPWWGYVIAALALTHVTIVGVTLYLHRCQTHHALDLHPAVSHFLRLWLWLTTGMLTKEWVAVHRKHHAKCETPQDPHSPQVYGIHRVLWLGVVLYVKESAKPETVERYGRGTPDDWIERNFYGRFAAYGVFVTLGLDLVVFGIVPGVLIWLTQIAWIPFLAAGVINGVGHYWGYRQWSTPDASTNIVPWGFLIGGEELHNTLEAIIRCRYEVLARYDRMLRQPKSHALETIHAMRHELAALWGRSKASREHLVAQLQDWCRRAEASGIAPLVEFSQRLRCYA